MGVIYCYEIKKGISRRGKKKVKLNRADAERIATSVNVFIFLCCCAHRR